MRMTTSASPHGVRKLRDQPPMQFVDLTVQRYVAWLLLRLQMPESDAARHAYAAFGHKERWDECSEV